MDILKDAELKLQTILENTSNSLIVVNKDGVVLFFNEAAMFQLNRNKEELLGKPLGFPIVIDRPTEIGILRTEYSLGESGIGQMRTVEIEWDRHPAYLITINDITELKELDRLKDELINTVSHELRTPMTSIRETVSQMLEGILGETTEKQRDMLSMGLEDIDRLGRIINNLLDISKLEAQKEEWKREFVDLTVLVEKIIASFHSLAEAKGLEIRKDVSGKMPRVYVNRDKITQVFSNLVDNALKFTEKGYVEISIRDRGEELECAVLDTGIGIAGKHLSDVFCKFTQLGRVDGPGEKGTGLGLAISRDIVELHGGRIWAESTPSEGAKFIFTLPNQSSEEVLLDSIENKIKSAKREHRELSVFVIRLDNYADLLEKIKEEKIKEFFQKMQEVEKVLRGEQSVAISTKDEMVALVDVNKKNAPVVSARIIRAVKEVILETYQESEISFSYGYASYPDDAGSAKELLEKAESNLISEKELRLKKHIMIVDDEVTIVATVKNTLQKAGYSNFSEAGDGKEALEKINAAIPDLLILDIRMPQMSGYEVIGILKENMETKDIPLIIMSAFTVENGKLGKDAAKKAIPVLGKPLDMHKFVALVNYLL